MKKYLITPLIIIILIIFDSGCDRKTTAVVTPPIDTTQIIPIKPDPIIEPEPEPEPIPPPPIKTIREKLIDSITSQLYVREITPNRAPMIDIYHRVVNCSLGQPWCASFVGANLTWQGVPNPKSAYSPNYALPKDIIWKPKNKKNIEPLPGDVVTYWYSNLGRVGHTGFYVNTDNYEYFITIEGNTNTAGSREGDGVYKKKRDPSKIYAISRYILENK